MAWEHRADMDVAHALVEGWLLAQQRPSQVGHYRASPVSIPGIGLQAVVTPEQHLGILLPVGPDVDGAVPVALRRRPDGVLFAAIEHLSAGNDTLRCIVVWFCDSALEDAFLGFCAAFIERLSNGEPVIGALESCYHDFRRLLSGRLESDRTVVLGLIGELLLLADLTTQDPDAASTWVGPEGGRHDFRRGQVAIEVKTSLRSASQNLRIRVNALDQLEPPEGGTLFLHVVQLEVAQGGATSIASLVSRIRATASQEGTARVVNMLQARGVSPDLAQPAFMVLARRTYQIGKDFPQLTTARLKEGRLDTGVSNVSYDIELSVAEPWRVVPYAVYSILELPEKMDD